MNNRRENDIRHPELVLASGSRFRASLLRNAGLSFRIDPARVSEREIEAPLTGSGLDGAEIAIVLAMAKAEEVAGRNGDAWVIGCDQTLSLDGELLHKPANLDEARRRLLQLSGRQHHLNSAICLQRNDETVWQHVEICTIRFRELDPGFVGRHVSRAGDAILSSVGAYQIEGEGVQLFESITGDYFSIMGLPLIQLLARLRELDLIDK
ncbi:MAG: Maf-like protein [Nitratireductor sp.]